MATTNKTYGIVDQTTLASYNRALKRLRDRHSKEFRGLLDEERAKDAGGIHDTP